MAISMESSSKSRKETVLIKYAIFSRLLVLFLTILWRSLLQPYDTSASLNPPCLYHKEDSPPFLVANAASRSLENSVVWDSVYFLRITECGYEYEQTYAFLPLLPFFISLFSRTGFGIQISTHLIPYFGCIISIVFLFFLDSVFAPLVPLIGLRAVMVLSGYIVSNLAFILAAIYLFRYFIDIHPKSIIVSRNKSSHESFELYKLMVFAIHHFECLTPVVANRLSVIILKDSEASFRASIVFCFNPASIFYSSM